MHRFSDGVVTLGWPDRAFKPPDPVSKIPVYMHCPLLESLAKIWCRERHTMHRITFWLLTLSVTFWIMKPSDYLRVLYKRFSQTAYLAYWLFFFPISILILFTTDLAFLKRSKIFIQSIRVKDIEIYSNALPDWSISYKNASLETS